MVGVSKLFFNIFIDLAVLITRANGLNVRHETGGWIEIEFMSVDLLEYLNYGLYTSYQMEFTFFYYNTTGKSLHEIHFNYTRIYVSNNRKVSVGRFYGQLQPYFKLQTRITNNGKVYLTQEKKIEGWKVSVQPFEEVLTEHLSETFMLRVACNERFYEPRHCITDCKSDNEINENCANKVSTTACPSNLTANNCKTSINECGDKSDLCKNFGTCHYPNGAFRCRCPAYHEDEEWCDLDEEDDCEDYRSECEVTGTCGNTTGTGSFMCLCPKGYRGHKCSYDVNECIEENDLCKNGGICHNTLGSFYCKCRSNYVGPTCASNKSEPPTCSEWSCENHGTCIQLNNTAHCKCIDGFYGIHCQHHTVEVALHLVKLVLIITGVTLTVIYCLLVIINTRKYKDEKKPDDEEESVGER